MSIKLFSVNPYSSEPVYKQLKNQIKKALLWGTLRSGEQLPTIKELSSFLSINPNTVARVFRELNLEGYIKSEPGVGTFILAVSEERNYREKKNN
ncbi:MAG: HTH-type transcriptional repressor YtrA [candidate division WS2 bacterium]|nr:HTH-type transcriptional repressor YtrA [Candidatus Lithacetigena glycinireducens]MBT9175262.1 HTH-type transcriptional repressor YtrA [Candidatus Lithacetigena glycinireducens]